MKYYPKVSIVVPTYNRADLLKQCLESIIAQDYRNLEIIVTDDNDDNSVDYTYRVIEDYIKQYSEINFVYVKNKQYLQGPNGNKNNGIDYASGEIIGIFDDDDILATGALKEMVQIILQGYDVVIGNCQIISNREDNGFLAAIGLENSGPIDFHDYICGKIRGEFWALFRKEILKGRRFDDKLYSGEGTLWGQLFKDAKVYNLGKVVRYYRINDNSVSSSLIKNADRAILNFEKDIALNRDFMIENCPCWLAYLHKGAAYFAKLSGQYKKMIFHLFKSLLICPNKEAIILFLLSPFPKKIIILMSSIRVGIKNFFLYKFSYKK